MRERKLYSMYLQLIDTIAPPTPMDNYYHIIINQISIEGSSASFEIHDFKCADPDSNPTHSQLA